jgi:NIPSNAP
VSAASLLVRRGHRASLPTSSGGLLDPRPPDGHGDFEPRELSLQRTSTDARGLPVLAPFVGIGLGRVHGADQTGVPETPKRPIKGGNFESRTAFGTFFGLLKDRVTVARPIDHTQKDVKVDASERDVLIASSHGGCLEQSAGGKYLRHVNILLARRQYIGDLDGWRASAIRSFERRFWLGLVRVPVGECRQGDDMIVEMRTYKLQPGTRSRFLKIFRSESMPAHAEIGMKILGPFESIEDPDTFFFMRGFPDLASREPMKAKFYEGDLWKGKLESVLMPMIEKYDVVLVDDREGLIRFTPS